MSGVRHSTAADGTFSAEGEAAWDAVHTIDDGSIGSDKLTSTGVTAGSYTNVNLTVDANGRVSQAASGVGTTASGSYLVLGGGVAFSSGLTVNVAAASYVVQGAAYASASTTLTATTANATFDRIDVVAVNSSGAAVIITGTPAAVPVKPDVDPSTQLELTFFVVSASSTSLSTSVTVIYHDNSEWTTSRSGTTFNLASTNNPHTGTLCIEGTNVTTGNYVQFQSPVTIDPANYDTLVFYIQSKATWPNQKSLALTLRSAAGVQLGQTVTFKDGSFGFTSSNVSSYQLIVIPMSLFSANGQSVTQLRMTVTGSGGTFGMYMDDFALQGGLSSVGDTTHMKWRGAYVATNQYIVNDVVSYKQTQYVCTQPGVGQTPTPTSTYWQATVGTPQQVLLNTSPGSITFNGTARWYPPGNVTLQDVTPVCGLAPALTSVIQRLNMNGNSIAANLTVNVGSNTGNVTALTTALTATDYLTADVTQSDTVADNLSLRVRYF